MTELPSSSAAQAAVSASPGSGDDAAAPLSVVVNGEARTVPQGASIADLLASLGLETRKVAVERNAEIVPRSAHAATPLAEGDRLEIIAFVGGG